MQPPTQRTDDDICGVLPAAGMRIAKPFLANENKMRHRCDLSLATERDYANSHPKCEPNLKEPDPATGKTDCQQCQV